MNGNIKITVKGTFGSAEASYSAAEGGHAYAISRAIYFLMALFAKSIVLDHDLATQGVHPEISDFGKKAPKE